MDYVYDHFDITDIVETNICPTITIAVYNIRLYLVLYLAFRASSSDHSQLQSDVGNSDVSQIICSEFNIRWYVSNVRLSQRTEWSRDITSLLPSEWSLTDVELSERSAMFVYDDQLNEGAHGVMGKRSRKILVRSRNLGSLFDESRSLVFLCFFVSRSLEFLAARSRSLGFFISAEVLDQNVSLWARKVSVAQPARYIVYCTRSFEGRPEERNGCLKWHACSFDQVSADNNNTLVMKFQTPYWNCLKVSSLGVFRVFGIYWRDTPVYSVKDYA